METILLVIHVLLSISIIGLVLLQRGKGADAGAALGGGASATVFGASGAANFLSRTTAILATAFFISSLTLAYLASHRETSSSAVESVIGTSDASLQIESKADVPTDIPVVPADPTGNDLPPGE